ncbi:MAG: flavodoxin family protein [Armatimonadota bacterium]|nr:flavodoxin family protein [Armatimonadota bacterium]
MGNPIRTVIGVSGSPRRDGNTDLAVREALRLLEARTGAETAFVRVSDYRILPCRGCRACMQLGHCIIQEDDFEGLMARFFAADLCVLGAPVYWLGPPGETKNFIDRTHGYYLNQSLLRGKEALILSVAADSGFEPHEAVMESWLRVYGATVCGRVRLFAREQGEVRQRPEEWAKIEALVEDYCARRQRMRRAPEP